MNSLHCSRQQHPWLHGLAITALLTSLPVRADTPAQICDRLANDTVAMDSINGSAALEACSAAAAAAPGDSKLQYEYGRALERSGKGDQAKQLYQWLAQDSFAPAAAALQRMAGPLTGNSAVREAYAQKLESIASIAARIAKAIPLEHEDPKTVLALTGNDPVKILSWVKSNTRVIPYVGTLRGPAGVLMDRSGNSLDRALFLADLLHRSGQNVRIARAQIDLKSADAIRSFNQKPPLAKAYPETSKEQILSELGTDAHLDANELNAAADATLADARDANAQVSSLYRQIIPLVQQELGSSGSRDEKLGADLDAKLRDHFWVQQQVASGWKDLDPDGDIVGPLVAATTFLPSETPADLEHRVIIRLVLETFKSGSLSETTLLEQSLSASTAGELPVVIRHSLFPQLSPDDILKKTDSSSAFINGASNTSVVLPVLQIGQQIVKGKLYNFDGQIQAATPENLAAMGGAAILNGKALASDIAGVFGDSPAPPAAAQLHNVVTAEWLDIDVIGPGSKEHHRRAIFDVLGTSIRVGKLPTVLPNLTKLVEQQRSLALTGSIDAYVFSASPDESWIARKELAGLQSGIQLSEAILRGKMSITQVLASAAPSRTEIPQWTWAAMRSRLAVESTGSVPVSPNVALLWRRPSLPGVDSPLMAFDIVSNAAGSGGGFSDSVAQGVLDTVIEYVMMSDFKTVGNVARLMGDDIASGRKWTGTNAALAAKLPNENGTALRNDLDRGYLVIAPSAPPVDHDGYFGWWRIDPSTGQTVGVDKTGRGDSMVEYALLLFNVESTMECFYDLSKLPTLGKSNEDRAAVQASMCVLGLMTSGAGILGKGILSAKVLTTISLVGAGNGFGQRILKRVYK